MIRLENISFSYTGASYVLKEINLRIAGGEYLLILGGNGSGKTTLIKLLLGLIKPSGGTVEVSARRIGYVAQNQDFNPQFPITVFEMLGCYRRLLKIKNKNAADEALGKVGMGGSAKQLVGSLSGGQYQKILIARALMGSPDLLVMDEPSAGVDVKSQAEIYTLIKALNRDEGITVVSVEHNLEAAFKNSTLIYHLSGGHGHLCTPQQYREEFLSRSGGEN